MAASDPQALAPSRRLRRRAASAAAGAFALAAAAIGGSALWTHLAASGHLYSAADAPATPVALVLGAGVQADGRPTPFLAARLDVARDLYRDGRARVLIVSGGQDLPGYDEPGAMRDYLVARGVPAAHVLVDDLGHNTYASCSRARRVYGVDRLLVVSQTYHLPRALAVCRTLGLDAAGVGDDTMRRHQGVWRAGVLREYAANVKAVIDVTRRDLALEPRRDDVERALAVG